jgi:hypothetical protein
MIARMLLSKIVTAGLTVIAMCAGHAHARGVSPYLPLRLAPEIERDIERVLILGDKPVLSRPLAAATVLDALPKACVRDAQLCRRVQRYLQRYMPTAGVNHVSAEASTSSGTPHPIANRHGLTTDSAWAASAAGYFQPSDYLLISAGVVADEDNTAPTGSMISLGFEYAQLDIGYRDHWFSPLTDSAMLMSTNAVTLPSITLSNYTPIGRLGVQYELFLAQMETSENIAYQGGVTTGEPRLAGIRVGIEPGGGWALSANRIMQFGGGERGGRSAGDFLNALFRPHDYDNTSSTLSSDQEFGNQAAAWTSRMLIPGRVPFAIYFEYAGEDASFSGNYRLGNAGLSMGIDFPHLWENFDLTYEMTEWQNGWYVHSIYGDGLTNEGRGIGHWFGDARQNRDAVGGQSHTLRLGWRPQFGGVAEIRYRTLKNELYTGVAYQRAHEGVVSYSYPLQDFLVGGEASIGRDVFGENYSRLAAFARFGGDIFTHGVYSRAENERDDGVDYFIDAGGSASRMRIELTDGYPKYVTGMAYAPHIALGARRRVSDNSDLGARIEFDRIEDKLLISVRALDYRYRIGEHFAWTAFAGAARYNLGTPAFGYYLGAGLQWRDLAPNVDLSLDVRYGDKLARDKLLPDDPPALPRPDVFYDLIGATLSLSYRL